MSSVMGQRRGVGGRVEAGRSVEHSSGGRDHGLSSWSPWSPTNVSMCGWENGAGGRNQSKLFKEYIKSCYSNPPAPPTALGRKSNLIRVLRAIPPGGWRRGGHVSPTSLFLSPTQMHHAPFCSEPLSLLFPVPEILFPRHSGSWLLFFSLALGEMPVSEDSPFLLLTLHTQPPLFSKSAA